MDGVTPLRLIGYNEEGLIGFAIGSRELLYLGIENPEEAGSAMNLPYISDSTVNEVNEAQKED